MPDVPADSPSELAELLLDGARYGDLDDVHLAIEQRVDVNAADDAGRTGACFVIFLAN